MNNDIDERARALVDSMSLNRQIAIKEIAEALRRERQELFQSIFKLAEAAYVKERNDYGAAASDGLEAFLGRLELMRHEAFGQ